MRCGGGATGAGLRDLRPPQPVADEPASPRLDEDLGRLERETILRALDETKQVTARAARVCGVSERSLWYKLKKDGLS